MFTDKLAVFTDWQDAHVGQCLLFYMPWVSTSHHLLVSQFLRANNISIPSTSSILVRQCQHAIHIIHFQQRVSACHPHGPLQSVSVSMPSTSSTSVREHQHAIHIIHFSQRASACHPHHPLQSESISMPSTSSTSVREHQHAIHTHGLQVWGYIHNAAVSNQPAIELIWNCWNVCPCEGLVGVGGGWVGKESKVGVERGYLMEFCPLLSFWSLFPFADYD